MLEFRRGEQLAGFLQILQYLRIGAHGAGPDLLLGGLRAHTRERCLLRHLALLVDELHQRQIVLFTDPVIILAEGRRDMDDAGAVRHRDIGIDHHIETLAVLCVRLLLRALIERLVLHVLELRSLP